METTKKRGDKAIKTGLAMLVFGVAIALATASAENFLSGFSVLVAFAGFITLIVGFGIRRERP